MLEVAFDPCFQIEGLYNRANSESPLELSSDEPTIVTATEVRAPTFPIRKCKDYRPTWRVEGLSK